MRTQLGVTDLDFFSNLEKASIKAAIDCRKVSESKFVEGVDEKGKVANEYEATFRAKIAWVSTRAKQ